MRNELLMLWAYARAAARERSRRVVRDERGAIGMEWILLAALLTIAVVAVVAIVRSKMIDNANSIPGA